MTDVPTLSERLARIAVLETALAVAKKRSDRAPKARAEAEKRLANLKKQVSALERKVKSREVSAREPLRIRNGTALIAVAGGAISAVVGIVLQVRLLASPLVWVETTCSVIEHEEDSTEAIPALRPSASFRTAKMPAPTASMPCFVSNDARGDGMGRFEKPKERAISFAEKIRKLYAILMLGGLGTIGFFLWMATETPTDD